METRISDAAGSQNPYQNVQIVVEIHKFDRNTRPRLASTFHPTNRTTSRALEESANSRRRKSQIRLLVRNRPDLEPKFPTLWVDETPFKIGDGGGKKRRTAKLNTPPANCCRNPQIRPEYAPAPRFDILRDKPNGPLGPWLKTMAKTNARRL